MGLEKIYKAKQDIEDLKNKKQGKILEHRKLIVALENLGVQEKIGNGSARSKTFNENLFPVESEIRKIAEEIISIRTKNDLKPSRMEVLHNRLKRLEHIEEGPGKIDSYKIGKLKEVINEEIQEIEDAWMEE